LVLGFFGFGFFVLGFFGLFGFFDFGFFALGFFGFFGLGFFAEGFVAVGFFGPLLVFDSPAIAASVEFGRSFMQWQHPTAPQRPFKEVAARSNLVESALIWRGAARLTQPPRPSNCSAQPLSAHQLDWLCPNREEGVKDMVWEALRRRLKATTWSHGTEIITGPPLLVISGPDLT